MNRVPDTTNGAVLCTEPKCFEFAVSAQGLCEEHDRETRTADLPFRCQCGKAYDNAEWLALHQKQHG